MTTMRVRAAQNLDLSRVSVRWTSAVMHSTVFLEVDEDRMEGVEVKKLEEDEDLQANLDEEKEGQEQAEAVVQEMTNESEAPSESDSDDDDNTGVSVMNQVTLEPPPTAAPTQRCTPGHGRG